MNASTIVPTNLPLQAVHRHPTNSAVETTLHLDQACQTEALRAKLPGDFLTLVSGPHHSIQDVLQNSDDLPVINSKVHN